MAALMRFTQLPPLSLYVHIPWCVRKCPYCDFNSHEAKGELPESAYVDAICADLEADLPRVWGRRVESIFIGGGTPSLFSPAGMDRLLSEIRARVPLNALAEITLEANPGTVDQARFADFREMGINRLSLGVQSFNDDCLRALGRIHDGQQAQRAFEAARHAGFDNINIDLMFGLPGQTLDIARADVEHALALNPTHVSYYHLTLEPNTYFAQFPPALPDDDLAWDMHTQGMTQLREAGYVRYEVSAFARDEQQCWHNLNYWRFGDYLGVGAGAHGKITDAPGQRIVRLNKLKHPKDYLAAPSKLAQETVVSPVDLPFEFMMNALRLCAGVESPLFAERTGLAMSAVSGMLQKAQDKGWITWDHRHIAPTATGLTFLNDLLTLFLPESSRESTPHG